MNATRSSLAAAPPDPGGDLLGWTLAETTEFFRANDIKAVHAETAWAGVHRRRATRIEELADLPAQARAFVAGAGLKIGTPAVAREQVSSDGCTQKFLLRFGDGTAVETVLMRFAGRDTACVSTQAGCAMGCVFCATGQAGFQRHLKTAEIVAQALFVARLLATQRRRLRNIVLMGQGEPLHNYDAVMRAIDLVTDSRGLAVASSRITLSTVGLVPGIRRLAEEQRAISLAVSLHAATDDERAALVPIARRWPLDELMAACGDYSTRTGQRIFFEWTLIDGRNDSGAHAARLAQLLAGQRAHVNLIPLNPTARFDGAAASGARAREFQAVLRAHGIPSTVRQRRGIDIAAGCGQLAAAV